MYFKTYIVKIRNTKLHTEGKNMPQKYYPFVTHALTHEPLLQRLTVDCNDKAKRP